MRLLIILFLFFAISVNGETVNKIDSLEFAINNQTGEQKLKTTFRLLNELWGVDPDKSLSYSELAEAMSKETHNDTLFAKALIYKANAYQELNEIDKSISTYYQVLPLASQLENQQYIGICYTNLGGIYKNLGQIDKAIDLYKKGLILNVDMKDTMGMAISYNNLGIMFRKNQQYDSALIYYENAISIRRNLKNNDKRGKNRIANVLTNIGTLISGYLPNAKGDPMDYFNEALQIRIETGNTFGEIKTLTNIADHYKRKGNTGKAEEYYEKAGGKASSYGNIMLIRDVSQQMATMYKDINDLPKAYQYQGKYIKYKDSLFNLENAKYITEIETKYETEKKDKENLTLKKDNELKQLKLSRDKLVINSMLIGIISILVLLAIIFILYRKRTIAYKNLVVKNLELARCDREILEKGDFIHPDILKKSDSNESELKNDLELIHKFNLFIAGEKPYLLNNINIDDVCSKINSNRTYLSNALKAVYSKSFNQIINEHRIRVARQILTDPKYGHLSIEGIGEMVGYKTRAAFHKNFKKLTGLTPSYFKASVSK